MAHFKRLDLTDKRNVYVVGDIHGSFSQLERDLDALGFDPEQDHLLCVGDLVDRGPESHRVIEFLDKPWFDSVMGNHDEWCVWPDDRRSHKQSGGKWFWKLYYTDIDLFRKIQSKLAKLPTIIEAKIPGGKTIGIVHAGYTSTNWERAEIEVDVFGTEMRWGRRVFKEQKSAFLHGHAWEVRGIDHVYCGHNVLEKPFHTGNVSWLDTGACWPDDGGYFTIVRANA
jgi:serine/threonine protein phosphatase 1